VGQLAEVLDSPEIAALVSDLEATRWTGRPGYPLRSMVGMALAKSIYAVPTWTRLVALVTEHPALRAAITAGTPVPSVYACYRFACALSRARAVRGLAVRRRSVLPATGAAKLVYLPREPDENVRLGARKVAEQQYRGRPAQARAEPPAPRPPFPSLPVP
jgi:hypothetical protein